jgi:hypothetical protein
MGLAADNSKRAAGQLETLNTTLAKTNELEKALGISLQTGSKTLVVNTINLAKWSAQASRAQQEMDSLGTAIDEAAEGMKKIPQPLSMRKKN